MNVWKSALQKANSIGCHIRLAEAHKLPPQIPVSLSVFFTVNIILAANTQDASTHASDIS
jgi:hypothetical protein